jgi:predicted nucleic acid-binding protein
MIQSLFLDANIIFSAAYKDGLSRVLFHFGKAGEVKLIASDWVLEEAKRNLQIKFEKTLPFFNREILPTLRIKSPDISHGVCPVELHEKNRPVLGAAVVLKAAYLITGDTRHFRHLFGKTVQGVTITNPRNYFQLEWGLD